MTRRPDWISISIVSAMGVLLLGGMLLAACSDPPDPKTIWLLGEQDRCRAMGGQTHWDEPHNTIECYRHPIARMTKHLFTSRFGDEKKD